MPPYNTAWCYLNSSQGTGRERKPSLFLHKGILILIPKSNTAHTKATPRDKNASVLNTTRANRISPHIKRIQARVVQGPVGSQHTASSSAPPSCKQGDGIGACRSTPGMDPVLQYLRVRKNNNGRPEESRYSGRPRSPRPVSITASSSKQHTSRVLVRCLPLRSLPESRGGCRPGRWGRTAGTPTCRAGRRRGGRACPPQAFQKRRCGGVSGGPVACDGAGITGRRWVGSCRRGTRSRRTRGGVAWSVGPLPPARSAPSAGALAASARCTECSRGGRRCRPDTRRRRFPRSGALTPQSARSAAGPDAGLAGRTQA